MATHLTLSSGAKMPIIGLGTWKSAPGEVKRAVLSALRCGYRHIDCAAAYGNEKEVGEALAEAIAEGIVKREDVFVTSKIPPVACHPDTAVDQLNTSLADLGLSYIDLYLTHWPFFLKKGSPFPPTERSAVLDFDVDRYMAVYRVLESQVDAGKIRHLGTSNMTVKKLSAIIPHCHIKPEVNQVEAQPYLAQNRLKAWCDSHGIVLTAYSPLGSPDRPARLIEEGDPAPMQDETVKKVASKHGISPAQVLIRWAVQRGTVVIPKSTNPERIAANLAVLGMSLDDEDMAAINALDSGARLLRGQAFFREGQTDWRDNWDHE